MSGAIDPDRTVDEVPSDPLDAGLAAAFGPDSGPPLPAAGSVVQALGANPVQLREPATEPGDPIVKPHSDAVPIDAPTRLQIHGEIARGGMGAVLKGRDTDLGREVAVKVLLETHQGRTELVQRFVEEAQIAGQLQHPGVVPVYEMGQFPDQRPYFTMKLVKGQTLAKLLAQRTDPAQDRPRCLGIFLQVCQALAYAHARGVIHRDLKPSNVMVGTFGEVQVMDWGLAKILKQGGVADEKLPPTEATVIRTARSGSATPGQPGSQTRAGQVMGTPAYMAPEQARGEVEQQDERADVFGLGAILCQILTGQPPYVGGDVEAVQARAGRGDLADAFARLDRCGADAELIALAKHCLCAEPSGRPRDAGALAGELTVYLGSVEARLRRAELERAAAEARAVEERKRRRVQLALAAALLALVMVGAGGGLWVQHQAAERQAEQARRQAEQRQVVEAALEKTAALREQAHWREAAAVLEQARQVLGDAGPDDLRRRLGVAEAELALVNRLDGIRQRRATLVEGRFDDHRTAAHDYAAAFREAGLGDVGDDEAVVAERVRASGALAALVAALDDWASVAAEPGPRSWLLGVARRADPDPWLNRFRDPATWRDRQALQALTDDVLRGDGAKLDRLSPQVLESLGRRLGGGPQAVPLLRAAQRSYPSDFWLNLMLGNALSGAKQAAEAVGYYRAAVALRPDASAAHNNLGVALADQKDLEGAIAEYHKAIKLDPKDAFPHNNLGLALRPKEDLEGAIAEYRKAIELDPNIANLHNHLGNALGRIGDVDGAIAEYRTAIKLDPEDAKPHYGLGQVLGAKQKELDRAVAEFREAVALDPNIGQAHGALGSALLLQGHFAEARTAIQRSLELLPERDPIRQHASRQLQLCERLAAVGERLPALLQGEAEPASSAEGIALGYFCQWGKPRYAAAARFYAGAFAADPQLVADVRQSNRYNAACCSVLAAAGQGEDAKHLPDKERLRLRRQALAWLRDDLAAYQKLAERPEAAAKQDLRQRLQHCQQDADLACVRDPRAMDRLPDDERRQWRTLWDEVAALLQKVEEKK